MKSRIWIALPLAAALLVPAYAQQDTPQQQPPQPPAATQNTPSSSQSQPAAQSEDKYGAHQPLQADHQQGFWGKLNPFARKKYVQRQMAPIRDRVNELDDLTARNSKDIKDVDARAQEGIRQASARANEADQHAVAAGNQAQQANQTAQQANTRIQTVSQVVNNIDQYKSTNSVEIRLRSGQLVLSPKAKEAIDQLADSVKGQNGYIFEVQGFSAGKGQAAIENSSRMAQSVVRYLVLNHDIPVYRIYLMGMGNAPVPASTEGAKARRTTSGGRVEISLLKNGVEQLGAMNQGAPAAESTNGQGGVTGTSTQPAQQPQTQQPINAPETQQPSAPTQQEQTPPPHQ